MTCAVFFNLDGVLTDLNIDFSEVYSRAVDEAGLDALSDGYEQYTDRFFDYFQRGWTFPRRQAIRDLMTDKDIGDVGQSDAFATAWEDVEAAETSIHPEAADLLSALNGYPLGVVTNGTGRLQRMKLEKDGLNGAFDAVIISSEIGAVKPMPAFFEEAKDALAADTYVIVSQDLRRDLLPAKKQEFRTVWVSKQEADDRVKQVVDRQVDSFSDIAAAVQDLCG